MKIGMIHTIIVLVMVTIAIQLSAFAEEVDPGKLVWTSPSEDSRGSMPIGNGDIGANVWVEPNGDLLFYLSNSDAWSENVRLLKLGRVRVSFTPNPFVEGAEFSQALDTERGEILLRFKSDSQDVGIRFAIDANHPVVSVDVEAAQPVKAKVSLEHWRMKPRELKGMETHSARGLLGDGPDARRAYSIIVEPDTILTGQKDRIVWYHRNERSPWQTNLQLQGLGELIEKQDDPLLYRTFGALIQGEGLVSRSDTTLESAEPSNRVHLDIYPLTAQTETADAWLAQLETSAETIAALSLEKRREAHRAWWKAYRERSHIRISTKDQKDKTLVDNINCGYHLQRFMNACAGRGRFPIKFNGSLFTTDDNDNGAWDADYRRWGGAYWWQNTRLLYWSMLESGDFDLMQPLFRMFRDNLETRKAATRKYYDHDGVFYPETQYFWGTYTDQDYGRDRSNLPEGMTMNKYVRYYWQGGLELSLIMLDHYAFTGDDAFASDTLVPLVSEILTFFDQHWKRDDNGKIRFDPAMALETYRVAVNPMPEIVGIQKVCQEMLGLPEALTTSAQRKQMKRLISELPPLPMREVDGRQVLACADSYSGRQNGENPELYAIFPYRRFGLGKPELELARRTFANRGVKGTGGWQQDAIKAAYLGLTKEAAGFAGKNFSTKSGAHRFPAMWGPNIDWVPDQDHGSVAVIALQRMLLQYDCDKIYLLPAWPKHWDVEFKLHAPEQTSVEGRFEGGKLIELKVTPESRRKDVIVCDGSETAESIVPPENTPADSTYCNPINLQYCFTIYGWNGREAADPLGVPYKDLYYLFASKSGGYWWSEDMLNWNLVPSKGARHGELPVWGYGPLAEVIDKDLVYSQQCDSFFRLLDPKKGSFEKIRDRLPISNDDWIFADDNGRVYLYSIGLKPRGIYVYELDPKDQLSVIDGPKECLLAGTVQPEHDCFRLGSTPDSALHIARLNGEGAQMSKRNGRYYLQASFGRTQDSEYRECAFVADSPWGPFKYVKDNPVSYRPAGFASGAGNSGVFADKQGRDWRLATSCVCVKNKFERRVSLFPAGLDQEGGMFTDTYLGDLPMYGPACRKNGLGRNLVGWMLLSYKKNVSASSILPGYEPTRACDENIQTWWSAKTGDKGEWLALDLGKPCRINALQINFAEQDTRAVRDRIGDDLYHQYTIEVSDDNQNWRTIIDKSANKRDVPHDYVQLENPVMARHVRISNIHMAAHGKFAVRDLRIFGSGLGRLPAEVSGIRVKRDRNSFQAELDWDAAEAAEGYVVRWGSAPNKLYHSQDVRNGTQATIQCLTGGQQYWFAVDSFNDSGIRFGKHSFTSQKEK